MVVLSHVHCHYKKICLILSPDRTSAEEEPQWTEEEWAAWEAARRGPRTDEEAAVVAPTPYARLRQPVEPKHPPSYRAQAAAHEGYPVAPAAPSTSQGAGAPATHSAAHGAGGVDYSQYAVHPTQLFPSPAPVYMNPPWAMPQGMPPAPQVVDALTGQVQYYDQTVNIFWGPPGLLPLTAKPVPGPAAMAPPVSKQFEETGRDKGGVGGYGDSGKGKGGGSGYGPQRRGGDEDPDKGKGKGEGKSSSSSRSEPWGPYRTGWLNKCTDLVVLILREKNSEAWQLAKAHANSSSMFPLLPTDCKHML